MSKAPTKSRRTPHRSRRQRARRRWWWIGLAAAVLLPFAAAIVLLWPQPHKPRVLHVVAVDETGFGTNPQLDAESLQRLGTIIDESQRDRSVLELIGIGADSLGTKPLGTFDFDPSCPNPVTCRNATDNVRSEAAKLVTRVIADNAGAQATDLFGALKQAGDLCRQRPDRRCIVDILSDGEQNDHEMSFLVAIPDATAIAQLIEQHRADGRLPTLTGAVVRWEGIGTDSGTSDRQADLERVWTTYLTESGVDAKQLTIGRTINEGD